MKENDTREEALKSLGKISERFIKVMKKIEKEQEAYWNTLTKQQQLDVFCCVSRRIVEGELVKKGSYRYVLYQVFGFGPEAYAAAQDAGYLTIHNSIFDAEHDDNLLLSFCKEVGIEDAEEKISKFWKKNI